MGRPKVRHLSEPVNSSEGRRRHGGLSCVGRTATGTRVARSGRASVRQGRFAASDRPQRLTASACLTMAARSSRVGDVNGFGPNAPYRRDRGTRQRNSGSWCPPFGTQVPPAGTSVSVGRTTPHPARLAQGCPLRFSPEKARTSPTATVSRHPILRSGRCPALPQRGDLRRLGGDLRIAPESEHSSTKQLPCLPSGLRRSPRYRVAGQPTKPCHRSCSTFHLETMEHVLGAAEH